ncbi:hypothetical protein [Lentibacter sp. XHP0401]|jgi:hypothetical protein|uniref:hypothetical protein n=1 Tax=Lentibacter sp. XHP0401 TaxID=2984334 RepID=UPI0021E983EB|nr:hypothetical protein [Lentibacter sp. XHP0401]MCV2894085.1 hypothetical protein [Lentibacter sp. XHP0401]
MKKLALIAAFAASPALADSVCEMRGAEPLPVMEAAKAEFLKGEYMRFGDIAAEIMGASRESLEKPFERMEALFPDGFTQCDTVLQRRDIGGLVQEVTTFTIEDQDFPMSLYLLAIPIRGEWKIAQLNFDTKLTDVLSSLQ